MPGFTLVPHPGSPPSPVDSIRISVGRRAGGLLALGFRASGAMEAVAWPGEGARGEGPWRRGDGLWRRSCFEAFVGAAGEAGYFEINLATSGEWGAYAFDDYRSGMRAAEDVALVAANWRIGPGRVALDALVRAPEAVSGKHWALGLAAVIEAKDGSISHWALAHPPGAPDFHDRDCFRAPIAAPRAR